MMPAACTSVRPLDTKYLNAMPSLAFSETRGRGVSSVVSSEPFSVEEESAGAQPVDHAGRVIAPSARQATKDVEL